MKNERNQQTNKAQTRAQKTVIANLSITLPAAILFLVSALTAILYQNQAVLYVSLLLALLPTVGAVTFLITLVIINRGGFSEDQLARLANARIIDKF